MKPPNLQIVIMQKRVLSLNWLVSSTHRHYEGSRLAILESTRSEAASRFNAGSIQHEKLEAVTESFAFESASTVDTDDARGDAFVELLLFLFFTFWCCLLLARSALETISETVNPATSKFFDL